MKKVINRFANLSDGLLESKTHSIISSMTGNAHFPTPAPTVSQQRLSLQPAEFFYNSFWRTLRTGFCFFFVDATSPCSIMQALSFRLAGDVAEKELAVVIVSEQPFQHNSCMSTYQSQHPILQI